MTQADLHARAAQVKLLLMDVDGVLTDGRLFMLPDGKGNMAETKGFDSQDGIALRWLTWHGIETGVISGRESPATVARASQVGMTYVYQGHIEKIPIFQEILGKASLKPEQVAYVGDDLTDLVLINRAGLGIAVANARPEVKRKAHYVTRAEGGRGAVREVIELILQAKGLWHQTLAKYEAL